MKILLVGATATGSGDVTLLLKKALEQRGCDVFFISTNEDRPFLTNTIFEFVGMKPSVLHGFSNYVFRVAERILPDVVFIYGSNTWISADTLRALQTKIKSKVVLWEVNNRCFRSYQAECIPVYDQIFALDSYIIPVLH